MKAFIRIMKALSDPNRLKIIKMLQRRQMCVCELQAALEIAQPTVSNHLKTLEAAGLVEGVKDGQWVNYSLVAGISPYSDVMLEHLKMWLEDDPNVAALIGVLDNFRREDLCPAKPGR